MDVDYIVPLAGLVDNYGEPLKRYPDEIFPGTNAALFNERGEVLLQRRKDNGRWGLPGGRMEIGESAEACAIREMFEETGVTTRVKRLVGAYSDPANYCVMRYPSGHITHYVILVYEVEYVSGNPGPSEESTPMGYPLDSVKPQGGDVIPSRSVGTREPVLSPAWTPATGGRYPLPR